MDDLVGGVAEAVAKAVTEIGTETASGRLSGIGYTLPCIALTTVGFGALIWLHIV